MFGGDRQSKHTPKSDLGHVYLVEPRTAATRFHAISCNFISCHKYRHFIIFVVSTVVMLYHPSAIILMGGMVGRDAKESSRMVPD